MFGVLLTGRQPNRSNISSPRCTVGIARTITVRRILLKGRRSSPALGLPIEPKIPKRSKSLVRGISPSSSKWRPKGGKTRGAQT